MENVNPENLDMGIELEKELAIMQKRNRTKTVALGCLAALVLALSAAVYVSAGPGNSLGISPGNNGYQLASFNSGTFSGGGGSCCGSGAGGTGGGSSAAALSESELQQRAFVQYEQDTGNKAVNAVVNDFGCHTQIDLLDNSGAIVASYGYQGGDSLYRIK